jgi:solute carrier family 25 carnitine/acylcarnitine transporter 20/29
VAGALGGLATFPLSAPTEVLKLRAQLSRRYSSWEVARRLVRTHGARGLYIGGGITAVRDAVGYGFYFGAYEGVKRLFPRPDGHAAILVAGGVAGCVTWASVYPLDVVKTRVQTQIEGKGKMAAAAAWHGGLGSWECARSAWREGGVKVFFDGLGVW